MGAFDWFTVLHSHEPWLYLTNASVFLTMVISSVHLWVQAKGEHLTHCFGSDEEKAFKYHAFVVLSGWTIIFIFFIVLQMSLPEHRSFYNDHFFVRLIIAPIMILGGGFVSTTAFYELGLKASLMYNFFSHESLPIADSWVFRFFHEPEEFGFWCMMLGWAVFTNSEPNLLVAMTFVACMLPYQYIENIPIREKWPGNHVRGLRDKKEAEEKKKKREAEKQKKKKEKKKKTGGYGSMGRTTTDGQGKEQEMRQPLVGSDSSTNVWSAAS